jgi:hypothetical protein
MNAVEGSQVRQPATTQEQTDTSIPSLLISIPCTPERLTRIGVGTPRTNPPGKDLKRLRSEAVLDGFDCLPHGS